MRLITVPETLGALRVGFRFGEKGTHTSRTIMLAELEHVLAAAPSDSRRDDYAKAIVEENAAAKQTASTRKLTNQRLGELYALDPAVPLFRILRLLWDLDMRSHPLLALLCALARDPLLRATATPVLAMAPGMELARQHLTDAVRDAVGRRLNDSILDKVVRNAASSWTQSGHLNGRARKVRQRVSPTPGSTAYALALGYLLGYRGHRLLDTLWAKVLDVSSAEVLGPAHDAKRMGLLDIKQAGEIVEINFPTLLTVEERQLRYGTD